MQFYYRRGNMEMWFVEKRLSFRDYHELCQSNTITGIFDFNYPEITDWSGTVSFFIQFVVEGFPGAVLVIDWVNLFNP